MTITNKREIAAFRYDTVTLCLITPDDLLDTLAWRNTYRAWFNDSQSIELSDHLAWSEKYQKKDNDFVFIALNKHQDKVGQAAVYNINWQEKQGEFGRFLVNPAFASQRYMKTTCQAMLTLCQRILGLDVLYLEVKPENKKAIHIYQAAGFIIVKKQCTSNIIMQCNMMDNDL